LVLVAVRNADVFTNPSVKNTVTALRRLHVSPRLNLTSILQVVVLVLVPSRWPRLRALAVAPMGVVLEALGTTSPRTAWKEEELHLPLSLWPSSAAVKWWIQLLKKMMKNNREVQALPANLDPNSSRSIIWTSPLSLLWRQGREERMYCKEALYRDCCWMLGSQIFSCTIRK